MGKCPYCKQDVAFSRRYWAVSKDRDTSTGYPENFYADWFPVSFADDREIDRDGKTRMEWEEDKDYELWGESPIILYRHGKLKEFPLTEKQIKRNKEIFKRYYSNG